MNELLQQAAGALNYTKETLVFALILARTMVMVQQTQWLGGKLAPTEIKMGLGVLFAIVIWPVARGAIDINAVPTEPLSFLLLMGKEVFIGMVVGFVNSLAFTVMEMAGRYIDTSRGASMSEVMDPHSGQRETPFGDMYSQLFLVIFVTLGAHGVFFDAFFYSFATVPITASLPDPQKIGVMADFVIRLIADVMLGALLLASPVIAAVMVTDVVFGILNRVAPQLNAFFMAFPVKALGAVILVFAAANAFAANIESWVAWSIKSAARTLELFVR